jgi:pimeloyl-ACP methyl ester carboxylesterase
VVTPPAGCRDVAESFPDARFDILAGLGHASYVEDPAAFNAALIDHIRSRGR